MVGKGVFFAFVAVFWVAVFLIVPRGGSTRIIVVGDWGTPTLLQRRVAQLMRETPHHAVISTGDQFYPRGVDRVDSPLFDTGWRHLYEPAVPWYMTLGNHDALGSIEALTQYQASPHWVFPARYYTRKLGGVQLIVLDSCSLVCGAKKPDFRCAEWDKLLQDCGAEERARQMEWLRSLLTERRKRNDDSLAIVSTHWSGVSFGGNGPSEALLDDVFPLLKDGGVAAIFHGHDHLLQCSSWRGIKIIGSGAGGYALHGELKEESVQNPLTAVNHFRESVGGIVVLDIPRGAASIKATFVDVDHNTLYETMINKPKF